MDVTIHGETCRSVTVVTVSRHFVTERSHGETVGRVVREGCGVRGCGHGAAEGGGRAPGVLYVST